MATLSRKPIWMRVLLALTLLLVLSTPTLVASGMASGDGAGWPGSHGGGSPVDSLATGPDPGNHDGDPDEYDKTQLPIVIWIGSWVVIRI